MPYIAQYLLKLSLSFAVVYLFYVLVLRRLTFYNLNRWYLLGYSLLSFFIPFVNISPILEERAWSGNAMVQLIPSVGNYGAMKNTPGINGWAVSLLLLLAGISFLLVRLLVRYISFLRIRKSAQLISDDTVKIYQVDQYIMPFSFGRSIFINQHQHKEEELQEIIRHEFIHVKQRHTFDILFGEIVSMLNWYNPFTWLIRHAIRQNLEFIADHQVLKAGLDRKQYQYLLLRVVGKPAFAIANQFNLSSLKNRIIMMNKMRSAKVHMVKFLFILPLITVSLLAFRQAAHQNEIEVQEEPAPEVFFEAVPATDTAIKEVIKGTAKLSAVEERRITDTAISPLREVRIIGYGKDTTRPVAIDVSLNGPADPGKVRLTHRYPYNGPEPLFILDGVPLDNALSINTLDPNSIESITVLKDEASTAIYGPAAKAGVILIVTKKGSNKPKPVIKDTVAGKQLITRVTVTNEKAGLGLQSFPGLIVVNGEPHDSLSIRNVALNPEEIMSVEVFKDKSAEAIYGSRGANGVIVVKTTPQKDDRITLDIKTRSAQPVKKTGYQLVGTGTYSVRDTITFKPVVSGKVYNIDARLDRSDKEPD